MHVGLAQIDAVDRSDDPDDGYLGALVRVTDTIHVEMATDGGASVVKALNEKEFQFYEPRTQGSGSVWDIALWPDRNQSYIILVDGTNNEMRGIRRSDGVVLNNFGHRGRAAGQFHWVHNISIDSRGNVYTTEVDTGKRVQKFTPNAPPAR